MRGIPLADETLKNPDDTSHDAINGECASRIGDLIARTIKLREPMHVSVKRTEGSVMAEQEGKASAPKGGKPKRNGQTLLEDFLYQM